MNNSKYLDRLAIQEIQKIINLEKNSLTKENISRAIHNILPILIYLGEQKVHEKISKIKKINNVEMQKKEFVKVCELIRSNIRNVSS